MSRIQSRDKLSTRNPIDNRHISGNDRSVIGKGPVVIAADSRDGPPYESLTPVEKDKLYVERKLTDDEQGKYLESVSAERQAAEGLTYKDLKLQDLNSPNKWSEIEDVYSPQTLSTVDKFRFWQTGRFTREQAKKFYYGALADYFNANFDDPGAYNYYTNNPKDINGPAFFSYYWFKRWETDPYGARKYYEAHPEDPHYAAWLKSKGKKPCVVQPWTGSISDVLRYTLDYLHCTFTEGWDEFLDWLKSAFAISLEIVIGVLVIGGILLYRNRSSIASGAKYVGGTAINVASPAVGKLTNLIPGKAYYEIKRKEAARKGISVSEAIGQDVSNAYNPVGIIQNLAQEDALQSVPVEAVVDTAV